MSETSIKPDELRTAADELEKLVTPEAKQIFTDIAAMRLNAGNFDAAKWIEDRAHDRRAALLRHVEDIEFASQGLADTLRNVASTIEGLDDENAQEDAFRYQADQWVSRMEDRDHPAARAPQLGDDDTYSSGDNGSIADRPVIEYQEKDGKVTIDANDVDYKDSTWEDDLSRIFHGAAEDADKKDDGEHPDVVTGTSYDGGFYSDDLNLGGETILTADPKKDD